MLKPGLLQNAARILRPLVKYTPIRKKPAHAWLNEARNIRTLQKMGISKRELNRLKNLPEHFRTTTHLFNKEIIITSPFWYLHGLKELFIDETYKFLSGKKQPLIIDCGSNIGLSVIYFKQLFPKAKVLGFEPDPGLYHILTKNLDAFNFNDVSVFEKAVWTENTNLNFRSDGSVGGSLELQKAGSDAGHSVQAISLRDLLSENIDFLKIDIEGPEDLVLADCADRLKNVQQLFIEYHSLLTKQQSLGEMLNLLRSCGFRYYIKEAWENMHHPFVQKKGLFYDLQLNIFAYRP